MSVNPNLTGRRIVQTHQQMNQGTFASAGRPDQRHRHALLNRKGQILQHRLTVAFILKLNVIELDPALNRRRFPAGHIFRSFVKDFLKTSD